MIIEKNINYINMELCSRQNSENETKENTSQSVSHFQGKDMKQKNTGHTWAYSRQESEQPLTETHPSVEFRMNVDYNSKESGLSIETDLSKERMENKFSRCWVVQILFNMVSLVSLVLVLYLFYKTFNVDVKNQEEIIGQSIPEPVFANDDRLSGNFKLDQNYLSNHQEIRWMSDEYSAITPDRDESCLVVPVAGKYLVISRFTFKLPPGDNRAGITHKLRLKSKTNPAKSTVFKRQYVSVIEHRLTEGSELTKPSVFIQSFEFEAGDKVCMSVSRPELLYKSSLDNDVNIIQI